MKRLSAIGFVVIVLAGCQDTRKPTPTEPAAAPSAAAGKSSDKARGGSSICAAYAKQLAASKAVLAKSPADRSAREEVATYQAVIADACE